MMVMWSSSSIGNVIRCCLCGILFVTLVFQQARNVLISLQKNATPHGSSWRDDLQNKKFLAHDVSHPLSSPSSSSWMGNYWIPPPDQPLYSGLEFQMFFPPYQSVLMIGDTWLRHSYAMLHAILNNTNKPANVRVSTLQEAVEHALNHPTAQCSHKNWTLCWGLPPSSMVDEVYSYDFVQADCLHETLAVLERTIQFDKYKMILLGFGSGCSEMTNSRENLSALRARLLHLLSNIKNISVVWRTTPNLLEAVRKGGGWDASLTENRTAWNQEIRETLYGLPVTIVDWAAAMEPKAQVRPLPTLQHIVNLIPPTAQAAQLVMLQQLLHSLQKRKTHDGAAQLVEIS